MSQPTFQDIRAVIYDMDGLLLDTERLYKRAYQKAANELGYDFPDEFYVLMIGHRADASQRILREAMPAGAAVEDIIDAARRYYYTLIEDGGLTLKEGVAELLDFCDQRGLPMAVATSTHRRLTHDKLRAVKLLPRFKAILCGDQITHGKPAPDIHLAAAHALGIEPRYCLVLEDSPAGLQAAHAAGTIPVHIPDLKPPTEKTLELAWRVYPTLTEFLKDFRAAVETTSPCK